MTRGAMANPLKMKEIINLHFVFILSSALFSARILLPAFLPEPRMWPGSTASPVARLLVGGQMMLEKRRDAHDMITKMGMFWVTRLSFSTKDIYFTTLEIHTVT